MSLLIAHPVLGSKQNASHSEEAVRPAGPFLALDQGIFSRQRKRQSGPRLEFLRVREDLPHVLDKRWTSALPIPPPQPSSPGKPIAPPFTPYAQAEQINCFPLRPAEPNPPSRPRARFETYPSHPAQENQSSPPLPQTPGQSKSIAPSLRRLSPNAPSCPRPRLTWDQPPSQGPTPNPNAQLGLRHRPPPRHLDSWALACGPLVPLKGERREGQAGHPATNASLLQSHQPPPLVGVEVGGPPRAAQGGQAVAVVTAEPA